MAVYQTRTVATRTVITDITRFVPFKGTYNCWQLFTAAYAGIFTPPISQSEFIHNHFATAGALPMTAVFVALPYPWDVWLSLPRGSIHTKRDTVPIASC